MNWIKYFCQRWFITSWTEMWNILFKLNLLILLRNVFILLRNQNKYNNYTLCLFLFFPLWFEALSWFNGRPKQRSSQVIYALSPGIYKFIKQKLGKGMQKTFVCRRGKIPFLIYPPHSVRFQLLNIISYYVKLEAWKVFTSTKSAIQPVLIKL